MKRQQLNVREIQRVSIDILSWVDNFCRSHDIHYSLGYGALIGAIRHKGCIPWDDDIDIIMTRPEYKRLVELFNEDETMKEKGLKLFAPELGNNYFPISRICDMRRTKVYKYYQWSDEQTGVWIDIFVIEAMPDGRTTQMMSLVKKCMKACRSKVLLSKDLSLKKNIKNIVKRLIFALYNRDRYISEYLSKVTKIDWDSAQVVGNYASPYSKDIFAKDIFDKYIRVPFEDIEVSVISSYDHYLKTLYGNYMRFPPKKQQMPRHSANIFWWK